MIYIVKCIKEATNGRVIVKTAIELPPKYEYYMTVEISNIQGDLTARLKLFLCVIAM